MSWLRVLASRLRGMFVNQKADCDLDREIEEHLRSLAERFVRQGMSPEEAKCAAGRQFGGVTQLRESHRDARGAPWIEHILRDLLLALRLLRKRLAFSLVAIMILALGIGANTAVYSVAKAVIFAPLPFPHPDRLVYIGQSAKRYDPTVVNTPMSVRNGLFQDWREMANCFENIAAVRGTQFFLGGGQTQVVEGMLVSEGFFATLGVPARLGRHFTADDYANEGARAIVLSDNLWRTRYNADPSILDREIIVNGAAHRVIGVMPAGFFPTHNDTARGERDPQVFLPLRWSPATKYSRTEWGNRVYARVKPGLTLQQVQAEMDRVAAQIRAAHPEDSWQAMVVPLADYLFGQHEHVFVLLLAAVGLVLFIACANVSNLLLARALERQGEFAVRAALGAGRVAILRQVLMESLVIAGVGGLAGVALSPLLIGPTLALLPAASMLPRLDQVRLDPGVLLFTLILSIACGLLFGMVPAIRAGRGSLAFALSARGRGASIGKREGHLSNGLVIIELALSMVLLVGGGLLTRAFLKLLHTDPGFRPVQSVALRLSVPAYRYGNFDGSPTDVARRQLYDRLEQAMQSLPNVEKAGVAKKLPLRQFWDNNSLSIEGRPPMVPREGSPRFNKRWGLPVHGEVSLQPVSLGYFGALGIPLIRGRLFDQRDRPESPKPAVINQALARKFFPNEDPIGKRIAATGSAQMMTIVGIVGDCRLDGMDSEALPELFMPMAYQPTANAWLIARARGDTDSIAGAVRRVVHEVDSEVGIADFRTMTDVVGDSLWRERLSAVLVGLIAVLAVSIAAGGLYAVISKSVDQRMHELGVRVALGASAGQIAQTVLGRGLRVTAVGLGLGTMLAITGGSLLAQQGWQTSDLSWMLAVVAGLLLVLALAACWVPVRKALGVDPVTVLRSE